MFRVRGLGVWALGLRVEDSLYKEGGQYRQAIIFLKFIPRKAILGKFQLTSSLGLVLRFGGQSIA